jgi:tRNA threonylcarbamoyladenosine biosynthesis protein TsaE
VKSQIFHTDSEEETIALGEKLAGELPVTAAVLLIGQLGAGKTTLAKGIVKGLGAAKPEDVSSPTFTLIHEYSPSVYHIDLYRLDTAAQVATLGLDEILDRRSNFDRMGRAISRIHARAARRNQIACARRKFPRDRS